jgi:DnaJ-class molecular chaperone with C-terminal Zn finger domain
METLYDLLGACVNDDAETLKKAFRKAVKANHPDLNAGDAEASTRFSRVICAYAILREEEKRAAYDRSLELKREQLRSRSKRIVYHTVYDAAFGAMAVFSLAIMMLVGGSIMFTRTTPVVVKGKAPASADLIAFQSLAQTEATDLYEPRDKSDRAEVALVPTTVPSDADGIALGNANGAPAISAARTNLEVPKAVNVSGASVGQTDANALLDLFKKAAGGKPLTRNNARSTRVQLSPLEKDGGLRKSSSVEYDILGKSRMTMKPQATSRSLEVESAMGTLQAHALDGPDIVYIDGQPCNSLCQSYMTWSSKVSSRSGRYAPPEPR